MRKETQDGSTADRYATFIQLGPFKMREGIVMVDGNDHAASKKYKHETATARFTALANFSPANASSR
jgi:hypothetical protein